jgi:hypothetical protein
MGFGFEMRLPCLLYVKIWRNSKHVLPQPHLPRILCPTKFWYFSIRVVLIIQRKWLDWEPSLSSIPRGCWHCSFCSAVVTLFVSTVTKMTWNSERLWIIYIPFSECCPTNLVLVCACLFLYFWDRVSLCSPDWFELSVLLPHPPKCWEYKRLLPCLAQNDVFLNFYEMSYSISV